MIIRPLGANKCAVATSQWTMLVSYETPVACIMDGKAFKTDKHWSRTTSKHINKFLEYLSEVEAKPQSFFDNLMEGI